MNLHVTARPQPELVLCELTPTPVPGLESYSPFCLKAHRALRAAGLRYTSRHSANPGAFRALNPTGQAPVLLIDGRPVPDSTRIVEAILELAPGALDASPEAWLYEELADTALNGFVVAARWADEANWPASREAYFAGVPRPIRGVITGWLRRRVIGALVARDVWRAGPEACWARLEKVLDHLEARAPARGFWCGPRLSVADVALFGQLRQLRTPLTPAQARAVERRCALTAWLERVDAATQAGAEAPHARVAIAHAV